MTITVGSWNIWVYGPQNYHEMAKLIKQSNIEILGVQEAAIYFNKEPNINSAEELAKELGYQHVFYPSVDGRPYHPRILGNAVISKYPIIMSKSYRLNPSNIKFDGTTNTEQRVLIQTKIKLNNEVLLNFFTAHLHFSLYLKTHQKRQNQIKKIQSILKKTKKPLILTGDFNSSYHNEEIKVLETSFNRLDNKKPTWPTVSWEKSLWKPELLSYQIDHIFISEDIQSRNFNTINTNLSDHALLKAEIKL